MGTVTKKVPFTKKVPYEVEKIVERTEYDEKLYKVPKITERTVYDTFNYHTSEQIPTTTNNRFEYTVGKRIPVYKTRKVPVKSYEETEHTTFRNVPRSEIIKNLETHSHVLDHPHSQEELDSYNHSH